MALTDKEQQALLAASENDLLDVALDDLRGRIALVSSFGAESALLLAMLADRDADAPVLFLETGRHFPETLAYRDRLTSFLGLSNVRSIGPTAQALHDRDPQNQLAAFDPDACCALRKVEPLDAALPDYDAWITGRKRGQASTRANLSPVEILPDGRAKLNPLANWTPHQIDAEMTRRNLPRHPLAALGYKSIGCEPCTRPVKEGEDPRAGRWSGQGKTECGIHLTA